jgi:hypothetical protein
MPTSVASGTKTADGTEQDLGTDTSNKIFRLVVDTAAMVNGEAVELRIYTKCLTGGTERLAYLATYVNAQAEPMKYSWEVPADIHIRCTLKQTAYVTAYKDFPWKLLDVGADTIKAKTDNLPSDPADQSQVEAAIAALNDISVADILAGEVEGSLTLAQVIRIMLAALAEKSSGGGTSTVKFRDHADSKDRITATVDASGNRTAVTLDGS